MGEGEGEVNARGGVGKDKENTRTDRGMLNIQLATET